jgi:hypothetical protein
MEPHTRIATVRLIQVIVDNDMLVPRDGIDSATPQQTIQTITQPDLHMRVGCKNGTDAPMMMRRHCTINQTQRSHQSYPHSIIMSGGLRQVMNPAPTLE